MSQFFIDVGKIKLTWQGNWSNSTAYVVDDLVWFDDGSTVSTYISLHFSHVWVGAIDKRKLDGSGDSLRKAEEEAQGDGGEE